MPRKNNAAKVKGLKSILDRLKRRKLKKKTVRSHSAMDVLVEAVLNRAGMEDPKRVIAGLQSEFVDWNEVRVATLQEILDAVGLDPKKHGRPISKLQTVLISLFNASNRVDISSFSDMQPEGIIQILSCIKDLSPSMEAKVLLYGFGIHAFPAEQGIIDLLIDKDILPKRCTEEKARKVIEGLLEPKQYRSVYELLAAAAALSPKKKPVPTPVRKKAKPKKAKKTKPTSAKKKVAVKKKVVVKKKASIKKAAVKKTGVKKAAKKTSTKKVAKKVSKKTTRKTVKKKTSAKKKKK